MMQLRSSIEKLAQDFASSVLGALKGATLADITDLTGGGAPRRGPGRPPRSGASKAAAPAAAGSRLRRVKKGGRRSASDLQTTVNAIVSVLKTSSAGLRSEQLQKKLGLSKKDVTRPL